MTMTMPSNLRIRIKIRCIIPITCLLCLLLSHVNTFTVTHNVCNPRHSNKHHEPSFVALHSSTSGISNSSTNSSLTDGYTRKKKAMKAFQKLLYCNKFNEAEEFLIENDLTSSCSVMEYTILMNGFVKEGNLLKAYDNFARIAEPDLTAFNSIIYGLASHGEPEKAEILLRRFEETSSKERPNEYSYKPVLFAHLNTNTTAGIKRGLSLLYRIEDLHARGGHDIKPKLDFYNMVLGTMGRIRDGDGALKLLKHMVDGPHTPQPDTTSYNCAINAQKKGNKAAAILAQMEEMDVPYNEYTFGSLIDVYARNSLPSKAESVVQYMKEQYSKTKLPCFRVNVIHYNSLIDAWVRSKERKGARRAVEILEEMLQTDSQQNEDVKPDMLTFNLVMRALGKLGDARSAQRAEDILVKLESGYYGQEMVQALDNKTYNIVINIWSKCREKGSARKAELIFQRLNQMYASTKRKNCKADVYTYTSLVDAYSKIGASRRAEDIVALMKSDGVSPNVYTYNTLISSWARSGESCAIEEAERIIGRMSRSGVKPNASSYTALMDVYSKSRNNGMGDEICHRVEEILHLLEQKSREGDETMRPTVWSYTTVINAFAKSNEKLKALKARSILNSMKPVNKEEGFVEPNVYTYNAVLNACAYSYGDSEERRAVFNIASKTLADLSHSDQYEPDSITYGTFLRCCNKLMERSSERNAIVESIFYRCVNERKTSPLVYNQLRETVEEDLYTKLRQWETDRAIQQSINSNL